MIYPKTLTLSMIILAVLSGLILISCDRFDNNFQPAEEDHSFVDHLTLFSQSLRETLQSGDIDTILDFYSEDYLNDGLVKEDIESYYNGLSENVTEELNVEIVSSNSVQLSFTYQIIDVGASIDTLIVEYTLDKSANYLFIGNQQTPVVSEDKRVLVELFTATWCPNCPYVEAALYNLKQLYGNRMYYIEYHIQDQLAFGHNDILNYYQLPPSLPVGITQGNLKITGGSAANSFAEYDFAVSQFLDQTAEFQFEDFSYEITGNILSFSIQIATELTESPDLQLRYALIEKETTVNNAQGQPCRNVVITKGSVPISVDLFNELVTEEFLIPDFSFSNPRLTVWLQTIETEYDSETCLIHNVNEYEIVLP